MLLSTDRPKCLPGFSLFVTLFALALSFPAPTETAKSVDERLRRFELFSDCGPMRIVINMHNSDSSSINITKESIETSVKNRLLSARLYSADADHVLHINLNVVGAAFSIDVDFLKRVYDPLSDNNFITTTWDKGSTGVHGGESYYVLYSMSQLMDEFLVEFLSVNEEAC